MMIKKNMQINEIAMQELMKKNQPEPTSEENLDEDDPVRMVQKFQA